MALSSWLWLVAVARFTGRPVVHEHGRQSSRAERLPVKVAATRIPYDAASMSNADDMLAAAAERADQLAAAGLSPRPRRKVAVLACMDTRIDLFPMLGIERGDAHIIRNAGGLVTDDALRSLSASQRLLGTEEIVVVMHENCGLHGASDEEFASTLAEEGIEPSWQLGAFDDLESALRDGLTTLRSSPELPARDHIRGFIYDPETGKLREVDGPPA
jgi:carbonic anhydrase